MSAVDLDSMSLAELKKYAKGRRIKQYYILPKEVLLSLLKMPELPLEYRIEKLTITQMRDIAKQRGLRGFWGLSKDELKKILFSDNHELSHTTSEKHQQDDSQTSEHKKPQDEDPCNVKIKVLENA